MMHELGAYVAGWSTARKCWTAIAVSLFIGAILAASETPQQRIDDEIRAGTPERREWYPDDAFKVERSGDGLVRVENYIYKVNSTWRKTSSEFGGKSLSCWRCDGWKIVWFAQGNRWVIYDPSGDPNTVDVVGWDNSDEEKTFHVASCYAAKAFKVLKNREMSYAKWKAGVQ